MIYMKSQYQNLELMGIIPECSYGTLYAGWVEEAEVEYLIVDEVDKNISIINDLINRQKI